MQCATGPNPEVCKLEADLANGEVQNLACCGEDDGCLIATLEDIVPEGKIHCNMFPNRGLFIKATINDTIVFHFPGRKYSILIFVAYLPGMSQFHAVVNQPLVNQRRLQ